jgi:hypothetical protein
MLADPLSATLAAIADPTRRAILARLAKGEASVTELAEPFAMSLPAITKHLKVLERAGLLTAHAASAVASVPAAARGAARRGGLDRPLPRPVGGALRSYGGVPRRVAARGAVGCARAEAGREEDPQRSAPPWNPVLGNGTQPK